MLHISTAVYLDVFIGIELISLSSIVVIVSLLLVHQGLPRSWREVEFCSPINFFEGWIC